MRAPYHRCKFAHWILPDKEWLEDQYLVQDKSANEISETIGSSVETVLRWLRLQKIPTRSRSESRTGSRNPHWDGGGGSDAFYSRRAKKEMLKAQIPKRCALCGTTKGRIEIHHRNGDRSNNLLENLLWVCAPCHRSIHWYYEGSFEKAKEVALCR